MAGVEIAFSSHVGSLGCGTTGVCLFKNVAMSSGRRSDSASEGDVADLFVFNDGTGIF